MAGSVCNPNVAPGPLLKVTPIRHSEAAERADTYFLFRHTEH